MEKSFKGQKGSMTKVMEELVKNKEMLLMCRQPELQGLYGYSGTIMGLCVSILVGLVFLRNSLVKFLSHLTLRNTPRPRASEQRPIMDEYQSVRRRDFRSTSPQGTSARDCDDDDNQRGQRAPVRGQRARPHTIHITDRE